MKKIYFLTVLLMLMVTGKAQYTITADNNPMIGDTEITYNADTAGVSTGSSGAGQIWNYTGIVISPTAAVSSSTYVAKTSAPNYTAFPSATIAQANYGSYTFWDYTSSSATIYGTSDGTVTAIYSDPEILYPIPFTFGAISNDTFAGTSTISGYPLNFAGTVSVTGIGTGTLNMPGGKSYPNVLKIKTVVYQHGYAPSIGYTSTHNTISYSYISSVSKNSILAISTFTSSVWPISSTSYGKMVRVDKELYLTDIQNHQNDINFSLYPNPAASEASIYFVLTEEETYGMTIYNAIGQSVYTRSLGKLSPGIYNETIDLSGLSKGVYYVSLKGAHTSGVQKLVIQ